MKRVNTVFLNILAGHVTGNLEYVRKIYERNQYFVVPEFNEYAQNEVFVDCGAYVGDTLEDYISRKCGCFKKIYAFEPTSSSYSAMAKRIPRIKEEWDLKNDQIEVFKYGVGEKESEMSIVTCENGSSGNHLCNEDYIPKAEAVRVISLDEFFNDKKVFPTFIKADIEGEERRMLYGAKKS